MLVLVASGCLHDEEQRKILFASDRDGDQALYAMEPDGSGEVRVMQESSGAGVIDEERVWPVVSPDGRRVLIVGNGLWIADLADGSRSRLARGTVYDAAWSPDGERVAYSVAAGIVVVGRNGEGRRRLTRGEADRGPSWSPDGRRIAYTGDEGLWVVDADGRAPPVYVARFNIVYAPAWSPTDNRIAFVGGAVEAPHFNLYVVEVGGAPNLLLRRAEGLPFWSPDGEELLVQQLTRTFEPVGWGLVVVDSRSGVRRRMLRDVGGPPVWSPAGTEALFASAATGRIGSDELTQVLRMSRNGSERQRLTQAYPNGGSNVPLGWVDGEHKVEPSPSAQPTELPSGAAVLRVPHPVGVVAAEGDRAATAPPPLSFEANRDVPPLLLWSPRQRDVRRRMVAGCRSLGWPTVSGGAVAFDCNNSYVDSISHSLRVFMGDDDPRPREVFVGRNARGLLHTGVLVTGIAGARGALVFATERMHQTRIVDRGIWRLEGDRPVRIRRGLAAGTLLDARPPQILVRVGARRVAILTSGGATAQTIPLRNTPAADGPYWRVYPALAARRIAVLTEDGRLDVYRTSTGDLGWSTPVGAGGHSLSAAGDLVAYVRGREVRVRRLGGREVVFRVGGALAKGEFRELHLDRWIHADLGDNGLFYAYNLRGERHPGRVVFVPRAELERRLRAG